MNTTPTPNTTDPRWEVARRTPLFTCGDDGFAELTGSLAPGAEPDLLHGLVVASQHPTGWFVHAVHGPLSEATAAEFAEVVQVRVYLLLTQGPGHETWSQAPDGIHWVSPSVDPRQATEERLAS